MATTLYIDADACPVKAEVERVATRHRLRVLVVSNGGIRPSANPLVETVIVVHEAVRGPLPEDVKDAYCRDARRFGALFAINSSLHSYLIVSYAKEDGVSLDVGFYYMSNAMGRLLGTLLSGWVFQAWGLEACLWVSAACVALAAAISVGLPRHAAG